MSTKPVSLITSFVVQFNFSCDNLAFKVCESKQLLCCTYLHDKGRRTVRRLIKTSVKTYHIFKFPTHYFIS